MHVCVCVCAVTWTYVYSYRPINLLSKELAQTVTFPCTTFTEMKANSVGKGEKQSESIHETKPGRNFK